MKHKPDTSDWLFGRNPIWELLSSGRPIQQLLIADGAGGGPLTRVMAKAKQSNVLIKRVPKEKLDYLAQGVQHQGIAAQVAAHSYVDLDEILANAGPDPFLVFLDGLEDPHNLGSILRTADAVGCTAVVVPKRRSVGLTASVAKVSAGAIEHVPVCRVTNIADTLNQLKKEGFWVYGSDAGGDTIAEAVDWSGPAALVIGSEGKGLGPAVAKQCDGIISLPMVGHVNSLNASVAAGILMYTVFQERRKAKT